MKILRFIIPLFLALNLANAQQPKNVQTSQASATRGQITENLSFGSGKTGSFLSGSTLSVAGTLSGTPTGGTFDLSNLTLTLPNTYLTAAQLVAVNGSGINVGGKVDWSQLMNVPAGFADGSDDGGGGGSYTFTPADFNESGSTVSLDYTNGQKATGSVSGFLLAADWTTFNSKQAGSANLTTFASIAPSANVQSLLGAADYSAMRTQLSLVPGTNVQAYDADLTTYAGITPSANVQSILGSANYAAMRTLLTLTVGTNVQAYDADLTTYAGITPSANIQTFLGAANYAAMRTQLGLTVGSDVQAFDSDLSALAALSGTNTIYYRSASNTWTAVTVGSGLTFSGGTLTAAGGGGGDLLASNNLSDVASASTARTNLGLAIGTNVQAFDADLSTYAGITPAANTQSLLGAANYAAMRALLDLEAGTDFLAYPTGTPTGSKFLRDDNTWQTVSGSGMGGNYTVTGNIVASSGNVTINSATDTNIVLDPGGTGEVRMVGSANITVDAAVGGDLSVTGNSSFGTVTANAVEFTGASIISAPVMSTTAINVAKLAQIRTLTGNETWTLSATPADETWFGWTVLSPTTGYTGTLPAGTWKAVGTDGTLTTITAVAVPADGLVNLTVRYDAGATTYYVYGYPFSAGSGSGDALVANPLSQFASTTSSQLKGVLSDELGDASGKVLFALGTVNVASGKTATVNNTLTLTGTDGSTLNVGGGGTLAGAAYLAVGTSSGTVAAGDDSRITGALQATAVDSASERYALGFQSTTHGGRSLLQAHGNMGSTETFDLANGNAHTGTLDANLTVTLSNFSNTSTEVSGAVIKFLQDGTGSRTVTWPAEVLGSPAINPTAGSETIVTLVCFGSTAAIYAVSDYASASVADDSITYEKIQNVSAQYRALGRISSGAGNTEELTPANMLTLLESGGTDIVVGSELGTGIKTALGVNTGSAGAPVLFNGAGGTPSSITLTNGSGLPLSGVVDSTSEALGVGSLEIGHASDSTLTRTGAGTIAIEGVELAKVAGNIGAATATTPSADDNDTSVATTAYTQTELAALASDTVTFTNKTFDASATGNALKQYGYLVLSHPAVFGSGVTQQTTVTSPLYGQALFSNSADKATNYIEYVAIVPPDIDTSVALTGRFTFILGGADTGDHEYEISMVDVAASAVYDGAPGDAVSLTYTADGSGADKDVQYAGAPDSLTGWAAALAAGQYIRIRVARDGDNGNDGSTVNSYSGPLIIRYGSTQ